MAISQQNIAFSQQSLPEGAKARLGTGYLTGNIVYSPDGTQLVVPCSTGIWIYEALTLEAKELLAEYRIYNSSEIECQRQWWQPIEINNSVGFSSDGYLFAIKVEWWALKLKNQTSEQYTLQVWNKSSEQPKSISLECPVKIDYMVSCPNRKTLAGVYNPDDRKSYGGFKEPNIYLWDIDSGKLLNSLTIQGSKIDSLVFSPDGATIAIASSLPSGQFGYSESDEGIVSYEYMHWFIDVWNINTSQRKFCLHASSVFGFSPDSRTLAGRIDGMTVALWNANTGACNANYLQYDFSLGSATSLVFSPDGQTLAGRVDVGNVALWDANTGMCKHVFNDTGFIQSLVFSPDGQTLAGGCEDGTVLLWNVEVNKNDVVLIEKKEPYQSRATQIQHFCMEHKITTLVHFTRIENLNSILQDGLLGRSILHERGQQFLLNDDYRADRCPEANCLSISFPNYQLFFRFRRERKKSEEVNDSQWVVLQLDAKILSELDCAFCQRNAASNPVHSIE